VLDSVFTVVFFAAAAFLLLTFFLHTHIYFLSLSLVCMCAFLISPIASISIGSLLFILHNEFTLSSCGEKSLSTLKHKNISSFF
jgi:hypothetical protein